jgi:pilus assembly protein CpaF
LSDSSSELPLTALNTLVSESIDVVVHCGRGADGPRVTEIIAMEDLAGGPEAAQFTVTQVFDRPGTGQELRWSGNVPVRIARALAESGADLHSLLQGRPGVSP